MKIQLKGCSLQDFVIFIKSQSTIKEILDITEDEIPLFTISLGKKRRSI